MPHQTEAVKWMLEKEMQQDNIGCRGGLLADEMGLGKTIMMIGLLVSNYVRKTLIVVPAPLVKQWISEFKRTTGHNLLVWSSKTPQQALNSAPFVITTYNKFALSTFKKGATLGAKSESLKGYDLENTTALHKIVWDRAIFDEAHHLRNKNGNFWSAKILRTGAKWLISGTPVQNRKEDFYNLCSVLGLPASYYTDEEKRQELLDSYVLRRTKEQVGIQMPGLQVTRKSVVWSSEQEEKLSCDIHSASKYASKESRLKLINFARQSCTLPQMLTDKIPVLVKHRELNPGNKEDYLAGSRACSKIDEVVKTLVERNDNGAGKLVFCHFRQEIDTIEEKLNGHGILSVGKLDGRTKTKDRQRLIKEGVQVLILQIQSGCEGINLQEHYSEVYFVSPNWNPAVEDQAIARCHRIGQQKDVSVFRYNMTSSTFEKGATPGQALESENTFEKALESENTFEKGEKALESEELESPDQYIKDVQERKNEMRTLFVKE
jgi:SNF2 family DNA or RNA helicase